MNEFTIKDLENLSGIRAHTLRIWEQRYNFLKPKRTSTNIRFYSNDELKTVLNIALLNRHGFKISHIDRMDPEEIKDKIFSLGNEKADRDWLINSLVKDMIDLDIDKFEQAITGYISAKGIEETVMKLIFPFLEKTGILWQSGHLNPAQEHLVINTIRQKLVVAIETCIPRKKLNRTALLFLPEGVHQELGLLFIYYLLKSRGARTIYLGADVPIKDVEYILKLKKPDYAFVHLTGESAGFSLEKFIQAVLHRFGRITTIISGHGAEYYRKKTPSFVQLKRSFQEVMDYMDSLHDTV